MFKKWRLSYGIAIGLALQLGILAWMIESRASILRSGAEITLKVEGFDPRDFLRGDYVQLAYPAMNIPQSRLKELAINVSQNDDRIFVLMPMILGETDFWRVASADEQSNPQNSIAYLRGSIPSGSFDSILSPMRVLLGVERYYVAEGTGLAIEDTLRDQSVTASVTFRISKSGQAQISSLNLPDGRRAIEPFY